MSLVYINSPEVVALLDVLDVWLFVPVVGKKMLYISAVVVLAEMIPEEPQFSQKCGVLLGFFWGWLRGLLMLQTQPLDLLKDLPE